LEAIPAAIVVTCPECGFGNVFHQPHPYHAGLGNQGFLYNEAGNRTLTWSWNDPDYAAIAGPKPPWALTGAERQELEDRLFLAPDGTRWLFRNPARCLRCGHPISGPVTETVYYLWYDGSVDRDAARGWVPGLKDVLKKKRPAVPWSTRDVWLGVIAAAVIIAVAYGLVFLLRALSVKPNIDLWAALFSAVFELLFLVPVWWFSARKHKASARALGFVKFKFSIVAAGLGLLFACFIFSILYAYLLARFGLQVRTDPTPLLDRLSTPWPYFFTIMLIAPLAEEIFFRGFVFAGLRSRYDWRWAAAISAALFAAAHLEITFLVPAFVLGYLFACLYQKSNSVWPGVILHFLWNTFAVIAIYVQM
jgi:uncharacterized protein